MKKRILLVICLLASVFAEAQNQVLSDAFTPPIGHPLEGQCNCFSFSVVDPNFNPFVPLDPLSSSAPGYSYFWVWGDGFDDYEYQPSVPMTHCFNGNMPEGNHNVMLHLTPRKRPLPNDLNAIPVPITIASNADCGEVPLPSRTSNISFNHNIKLGQKFVVIIDAESCNKPSDFRLTFRDTSDSNLDWCTVVNPTPSGFVFGNNEVSFSLQSGSKRYYLELQCNNIPSLDLNTINFILERNSSNDTSALIDTACVASDTTKMTITSNPFDPNTIYPSHGQNMSNCLRAGDRITYNVQFQNEESGSTSSVKILVDLPPQLDASSFQLEEVRNSANSAWPLYIWSSSQSIPTNGMFAVSKQINSPGDHMVNGPPLNLIYDGSIFEINCSDMVLLGLLNSDDYQSTGYITFSAELLSDMVPGQDIATTSYVYFYDNENLELEYVQTNNAITSCASDSTTCTGKEDCCCSKCCKPNYWKEILGGLLAFIVAFALYWFKFRKK